MEKEMIVEIIGGVLLVGLLVFFLNPYMFWMPTVLSYCIVSLSLVGFGLFGGMVWREKSRDEREEFHAMQASRMAYLAGLAVLVVAASYQALTNMVDKWIFSAIAVMVLVKIATRLYAKSRA